MSIITYPQINKLATSQWELWKDLTTTNGTLTSQIVRLNNNSIKLAFNITGDIPKSYQIVVRNYNTDGTKIVLDDIVLTKEWKFGDSRYQELDVFTKTNTIAIIFKNLDSAITAYGFSSFQISDTDNTINKELEYRQNMQKNLLHRFSNSQPYGSTVFLSNIVKISKDKCWLSIKSFVNTSNLKIELLTVYGGSTTNQTAITLYDGSVRSYITTPLYLPVVPISKEFRIRLTNTDLGATTLDLKSVDIIEVDSFEPELQVNSIISFDTKASQFLNISSTIELISQPIQQHKYLHFENESEFSAIYLTLGGYKKTLQPREKFVFRNLGKITSFSHQTDSSSTILSFIGSEEKTIESEKGLNIKTTFRNLRGYNVIRPFPLAKNVVWGTKTNDNELWRFDLDNDMNIVSETLLQTFDLPVIDVFVTHNNITLISTGNLYGTDTNATNFKLYRSVANNWGADVTQISIGAKSSWFPRLGIDQVGSTAIVFAEYSTIEDSVSVWKSSDNGLTWSAKLTQLSPSEIRHFHTVKVDYNNQLDVYVTCGDIGSQLKWFKSTDRGETFTELSTGLGNLGKILGMEIYTDHFIVVTDLPGFENYILKINKSDYKPEVLLRSSQVFFGLIRSGSMLFAFTLSQHGSNVTSRFDTVNEAYYSNDDGKTWELAWRWETKSASGNAGFRYGSLPDRDGNIFLRTDRALLVGHFLNQNSIKVSQKK